jgi:hypothetical protein
MSSIFVTGLSLMADASGAVSVMREYVAPTIRTLAALAAIVCTFFIVNAGYLYMTSSGKPEALEHAKRVLRNAILGLVIVLSAATLTSILSNAYGQPAGGQAATLPSLQAIPQEDVSNGLVDVLIKAVTGFLNAIIQAVATPFLAALEYFTKGTPLMAENSSVFNLWLAIVGMTDILFVVVLALIGFHVMSAASFGFDEIEFKHMLPRIGLVFLLLNTSIFFIDGIIELSNALISAIGKVAGSASPWDSLSAVVEGAGGQGLAALLLMLAFLIFSVMLLVYYIGRLVTLFIGAVISPLVILVWLVPGFRDFSETAIKTYITTIFILFVHVVILQLAASLFTGMATTGNDRLPDTLMALVVGLATVMALLKTQGVMMQFSYASMGARNMRMLGGQFMNGVSYMTGKGKAVATKGVGAASGGVNSARNANTAQRAGSKTSQSQSRSRNNDSVSTSRKQANSKNTGQTFEAPKVTSRDDAAAMKTKAVTSKNNSKDKEI